MKWDIILASRTLLPKGYGWDGRVNGKRVDFGTYVYFAAVEYVDGTVQVYKETAVVVP